MNFNNRSDYLQGLLTALDGLYYYINDFNSTGIMYYDVGDLYNVQIGENTYQCLMLNDEINVTTGIEEIVHTDMPEQSETDYTKADKTDRRINQTYLIVDKQNQRIDSVISNVTEQNNKISQITQTVDELNSKIQDIADITTYGESQIAVVNLSDINESEPIMLKVRPITKNILRLYPKGNLYPSSTQYLNTRKVRFKRTYTEEGETYTENIDYELPDDLLYYDSNYYDEFYLDYDSQTCQITKRCEWYGGVYNIFDPYNITNRSVIGGISSITYDETETFKVIFDNEDGGIIGVYNTYLNFVSDSITISLQNLVNMDANNIHFTIYYYNGSTRIGYKEFDGATATIHNNDIQGNIANRWNFNLTYYNTVINQEYKFNFMVNTGTTARGFEPYNAIVMPKQQEQVIDYPYPAILLGDGDYEISLAGYDIGYLYVRLMAQNIYTTQFYTKVETNSLIQQNVDSINLVVERKLDEEDFTGANIILAVNNDSSSATISADKVSLYGKTIDLTADWIDIQSNNFTVDENGNMSCQNANISGTITSNNANITGGNIHLTNDGSNDPAVLLDNSSGGQILVTPRYNNEPALSITGSNNVEAVLGASDGIQIVNNGLVLFTVNPNTGKIYTNNTIESSYIYYYDTVTNEPNMYITSGGNFRRTTNTSSKKYKTDIKELSNEKLNPQKLYDLKVKQFKYKEEYQPSKKDCRYNKDLIGFIAEDVEKVYPIATDYNEKGEVENWNERYMIPAMLKLIQEQHTEIEQMKKEIEELKGGK